MRVRRWQIASYSLHVNCQDMVIQRVLIRHGFSRDIAELLIEDRKRSIDYFKSIQLQAVWKSRKDKASIINIIKVKFQKYKHVIF